MRKKSPIQTERNDREEIKLELQERIKNIDPELDKLSKEKIFYRRIIGELNEGYCLEPDYSVSISGSEISIEIITEQKPKAKVKKTIKEERQIAFEKARAWALDHKRSKKTK